MGELLKLLMPGLMDLVGKLIPDKAAAAEMQLKMLTLAQSGELAQLDAQLRTQLAAADIIKTEAASGNWLTASWRPLMMLLFGGLIAARWFGWSAPGLSENEAMELWSIVKIGIGGYVIGRSAEKVMPDITAAIATAVKK